jgi:hypothetical protein
MKKKSVKCKEVFNYICDNLDERIDSAQCSEIRGHLDRCPNCKAYLDSLRKTILLYQVYPQSRIHRTTRERLHSVLKIHLLSSKRVK